MHLVSVRPLITSECFWPGKVSQSFISAGKHPDAFFFIACGIIILILHADMFLPHWKEALWEYHTPNVGTEKATFQRSGRRMGEIPGFMCQSAAVKIKMGPLWVFVTVFNLQAFWHFPSGLFMTCFIVTRFWTSSRFRSHLMCHLCVWPSFSIVSTWGSLTLCVQTLLSRVSLIAHLASPQFLHLFFLSFFLQDFLFIFRQKPFSSFAAISQFSF